MKAETDNQPLFKELMQEFMDCFTAADADKDGKLNLSEMKAFILAYYDKNVARYV